jgi:hypothetical protein
MTPVLGLAPLVWLRLWGFCGASCVTQHPGISDQANHLSNHFQLQPSIDHCARHGRVRLYCGRYRVRARVHANHNIDERLPCAKTTRNDLSLREMQEGIPFSMTSNEQFPCSLYARLNQRFLTCSHPAESSISPYRLIVLPLLLSEPYKSMPNCLLLFDEPFP